MSYKVVRLPEYDEMHRRLFELTGHPKLRELFFSRLLYHSGEEIGASGVARLILAARDDCTRGLTSGQAKSMFTNIERYVDALVDDPDVAEAAKALLQEFIDMEG